MADSCEKCIDLKAKKQIWFNRAVQLEEEVEKLKKELATEKQYVEEVSRELVEYMRMYSTQVTANEELQYQLNQTLAPKD